MAEISRFAPRPFFAQVSSPNGAAEKKVAPTPLPAAKPLPKNLYGEAAIVREYIPQCFTVLSNITIAVEMNNPAAAEAALNKGVILGAKIADRLKTQLNTAHPYTVLATLPDVSKSWSTNLSFIADGIAIASIPPGALIRQEKESKRPMSTQKERDIVRVAVERLRMALREIENPKL